MALIQDTMQVDGLSECEAAQMKTNRPTESSAAQRSELSQQTCLRDHPPTEETTEDEPILSQEGEERRAELGWNIDLWTLKQGLNPAYFPLLPASYAEYRRDINTRYAEGLHTIYCCALDELENYLFREEVQRRLLQVRQWLAGFTGLIADETPQISEEDEPSSVAVHDWSNGPERLLEDVFSVVSAWVAESRLALAASNADTILDNLEQYLDVLDALTLDNIRLWQHRATMMHSLAAFLAQSVERFKPRQCTRLMALVERWRTGNGALHTGLKRGFARDQIVAEAIIPNSGKATTPDHTEYLDSEKKTEAEESNVAISEPAEEKPDTDTSEAVEDDPITPLAIKQRKIVENLVRVNHAELIRFLQNPFIVLPSRPISPEWLQEIMRSCETSILRHGYEENDGEVYATSYRIATVRQQMVAIHAAIRRFRWEYDRLPVELAELHQPKLIENPVTRKPFDYALTSNGYALTCQGIDYPNRTHGLATVTGTINLLTEDLRDINRPRMQMTTAVFADAD